ncbi:MAG: flagellar biosynthetic protein FliR [Aquificota bacterium]|nr:flagellar biosynthetic protein FliR [Aquificota bacterium]
MIVLDTNSLLTILLMFLRVFAFVFLVPPFGTFFLPAFVRPYLSVAVAFSLFLFLDVKPIEVGSALSFIELALQEVLFGFLAGFFLRLLLTLVSLQGRLLR